ncbi:MAG: PAS domain S-box protein [Chloroflexi bacterium]|nr:PAS domain S-box protein [Chloroflexota bacterium]
MAAPRSAGRRRDAALRMAESRLEGLLAIATDAIISVDQDQRIIFFNRGAEILFGYHASEVLGQPLDLLLPSGCVEAHQQHVRQFAAAPEQSRFMDRRPGVLGRRKDGAEFPAEASITKLAQDGETCFTAVVRDIAERLHVERELQRQLERQAALHTIDLAISSSLDLRITLSVLLDQVVTQLHVDAAAVLVLSPVNQRLEYAGGRGFRTRLIEGSSILLGAGYAGRAALQRRILQVPHLLQTEPEFLRQELARAEGFVGYCCAPLVTRGQVKGVLEVYHRTPQAIDAAWLDFLQSLGGQAAIAIDNLSLYDSLQRSNIDLRLAYDATLEGWVRAMDMRDRETEGHSQRVADLTVRLARAMGMREEALVHVRRGALLHDIGKMAVPDEILHKPGPLTEEEWEIIRRHPQWAYDFLSGISYLRPALDIPYCHHERWDGMGYPRRLKGEDIPLDARLFAIVDVWDALRSDRTYRAAWPEAQVREHLRSEAGTHLDPRGVETFLALDISSH